MLSHGAQEVFGSKFWSTIGRYFLFGPSRVMLYIKVCSETQKYYVFIVYHFFLWSRSTRFQPAPVAITRATCFQRSFSVPIKRVRAALGSSAPTYSLHSCSSVSQWIAYTSRSRDLPISGRPFPCCSYYLISQWTA